MGDFSGFSGCSFFDERSCFGDGASSEEDFASDVEASSSSCFFFALARSSAGMPSISAHWSGGGVGCFRSSSVWACQDKRRRKVCARLYKSIRLYHLGLIVAVISVSVALVRKITRARVTDISRARFDSS